MPTFSSPFFEIQELADGVYAVLGDQKGLCHSNAGIIDLGDATLVVDTLNLPPYGASLAEASRALTGRNPSWIVLTHHHADHWLGAQAFGADVAFVGTTDMLAPLDESMNGYRSLLDDPKDFAKQVDDYQARVDAETDEDIRGALTINLNRYRALLNALPTLRLVCPNTLVDGKLTLKGSKRSVELVEAKTAHTASDLYVTLPEDGILFMGDLGFFNSIPFLGFATPAQWIDVLKDFESSDFAAFVPGHGPVAGTEKVAESRRCIEAVVEIVRAALQANEDITGELGARLPEPFRAWGKGSPFQEMSFNRVAEMLKAG